MRSVIVLFTLICLFAQEVSAQALERELLLELDPVPEAKSYEVKIEPIKQTKGQTLLEKIAKPEFAKKLPLGSYHIHARAYDHRGVPGVWSDLGTAEIQFKAPVIDAPQPDAIFSITSNEPYECDFKWSAFHPDATYLFVLKNTAGIIIEKKKIRGGVFHVALPAGGYIWNVQSIVPVGVTLQGADPIPRTLSIVAPRLPDPKILKPEVSPPAQLVWTEVAGAKTYHIVLVRTGKESGKIDPPEVIKDQSLETTFFKVPNLDPGAYQFRVTAEAPGFEPSRPRSIRFTVKAPLVAVSAPVKAEAKIAAPEPVYRNLLSATVGPNLWNYQFQSGDTNNSFNLSALTVTSVASEFLHWFTGDLSGGWGLEFRGRQSNIYLYKGGDASNDAQDSVTVADRRVALLMHLRKSWGNLRLDGLVGLGTHHYTYLLQDGTIKTIRPKEGELREFHLGGVLDSVSASGHHRLVDFTMHPVSASQALNVTQTKQYTLSFKFLQNISKKRWYLVYSLENIRSSVTLTSDYFEGEATTISTWYRGSGGIGMAF